MRSTLTLLCASVLALRAYPAQARGPIEKELMDPDGDVRRQATERIIGFRTETVKELVAIVRSKTQAGLPDGAMLTSVQLLGFLRAEEAVDVLIADIDYDPPQVGGDEIRAYPCVPALARIGKPASVAAVKALSAEDDELRRRLMCIVILGVEGKEVGVLILRNEISKAETEEEKERLQAGLDSLEGLKLPEGYTMDERAMRDRVERILPFLD